MDLVFAPEARPFAVAALMLFAVVGIELVMMLIGLQLSDLVEKSFGIEHGPDGGTGLFSWINVGRVPFLVLVMIALGLFAMAGFVIQQIASAVAAPLPALVAAAGAAVVTVPGVRAASGVIGRIIPRDETYVIRLEDLVGRVGAVTVGPLDQGLPGNVRVQDAHGNWHMVRARAAVATPDIPQGAPALLVDLSNNVFSAVLAPEELGG
ncbi:OB-fold-containig protein [Methylopila musalis]|uniref:OB-fold-containig protein n=1 Tax=Methylopila musalis TaxID=1134781 RepID=A0ABW3Z2U7_9HYPH